MGTLKQESGAGASTKCAEYRAKSSILHSAPDDDLFVIDIPTSIEIAQGTSHQQCARRLLSKPPLQAPWPSIEPQTDKARQSILGRGQELQIRARVEAVQYAFESLAYSGPFSLSRVLHSEQADPEKRLRVLAESQNDLSSLFSLLIQHSEVEHFQEVPTFQFPQSSTTWNRWTPIHTNPQDRMIPFCIRTPSTPTPSRFHLPPYSTFVLRSLPFSSPSLAPIPPTGFNLVLLDPPWPNRSVHRSSSYSTTSSFCSMKRLLQNLQLPLYLSHDGCGIVAIWITNSKRVEDIVCGEDGWLAEIGMTVYEEWIWVKITTNGDPVMPVDSLWRKPFEVLVLARQDKNTTGVKRRVLFAVPDFHSRKPCLKELFERLVIPRQQNVLEIFARNLTAGWSSWGNEVLMFNEERHWAENLQEAT